MILTSTCSTLLQPRSQSFWFAGRCMRSLIIPLHTRTWEFDIDQLLSALFGGQSHGCSPIICWQCDPLKRDAGLRFLPLTAFFKFGKVTGTRFTRRELCWKTGNCLVSFFRIYSLSLEANRESREREQRKSSTRGVGVYKFNWVSALRGMPINTLSTCQVAEAGHPTLCSD